jgi:hypothetical protein
MERPATRVLPRAVWSLAVAAIIWGTLLLLTESLLPK